MQIFRTNLTPGMIVLLVILAVLFAFIVVPVLLIIGFCWLVCNVLTGSSPLELYLRRKARRRSGFGAAADAQIAYPTFSFPVRRL